MSYLAALRLHFAGRFQAAPSTVNNDPLHFDNKTFRREYQQRGTPGHARGWWNPRGNADWRFIGCAVTSASYADGSSVGRDDPVLEMLVADSDTQVAAKLVDLDPEQQMVSMIWGLEVRICDRKGAALVRGHFLPAPFIDIWDRAPGTRGDSIASAAYQSVLSDLEWGDVEASRLLTELRDAATDGLLSIRFNVDGYNMDYTSPDFTLGRVVGTIGVASASEPQQFVAGRQFMPVPGPAGTQANPYTVMFNPAGAINFCTAVVDEGRGKIIVDLGNALQTNGPGGPFTDHGELTLGYLAPPKSSFTPIGTIDYRADGWYEQTAGVVEVEADADQLAAIADKELALRLGYWTGETLESPGGLYVRADNFVYSLDPGDTAQVRLFATRYGRPYAGARIVVAEDPSGLQGPPPAVGEAPGQIPKIGLVVSERGIAPDGDSTWLMPFPATLAPTAADGTVTLPITVSDPGNPRGYIDGQLYGVRPALVEQAPDYPTDPWNFISLHVFDDFVPDEPITWWGCLQPVFQQYANLYPVMDEFLDLSDYESVCENQALLRLAFGLDEQNPNSMPVTRDLSRSKREAILRWLDAPGPDGKPLCGRQPATPPAPPQADALERDDGGVPGGQPRGGKAAAAARRRSVRQADGGGSWR